MCIFFPMFLQGMAGMHRRGYDGGAAYDAVQAGAALECYHLARGLGPRPLSRFRSSSISSGACIRPKVGPNPWNSTTLEWAAPSPPPHGNFADAHAVYRGPYEYSVPGSDVDFVPQSQPTTGRVPCTTWPELARALPFIVLTHMEIPYTVSARPDTGLYNAKIGIWLFLASEVMLFGGLFSAYVFLRLGAEPGYWPHGLLNVPIGTMNTAILIISSVTVVFAWAALKMRMFNRYRIYMAITILCGIVFLAVKLAIEWPAKFVHFGAYLKPAALEKYEPYLGNHYLAEKGLPRASRSPAISRTPR